MTHPQNRVPPAVFKALAAVIRAEQVDGFDLRDVTCSVDAGEPEFTGAGSVLWLFVRAAVQEFKVSAEYLISETWRTYLGWPVAS
jgi:hypothetical protein